MRRAISSLCPAILIAFVTVYVVTATPSVAQQNTTRQRAGTAQQAQQPAKVDLDELEDEPEKYLGKMVVIEGEVDRVLGPGVFTVDEREWKDLERELPVVV